MLTFKDILSERLAATCNQEVTRLGMQVNTPQC